MRKILPLLVAAAVVVFGGTVVAIADNSSGAPVTQQAPLISSGTTGSMASSPVPMGEIGACC